MPMFQHSKKDGIFGQELDLDAAVKGGVLGGGEPLNGVAGGDGGDEANDKLDLKKMIEELNLPEVPSVFICPISLEPMQDPVTLCTGQTYERSNILRWFTLGHYTCPTTMQELWDDTVTPNKTLHHLTYTWFHQKYLQMKKRSEDAEGRAMELLTALKKAKGQARIQALKELRQLTVHSRCNKKPIFDENGASLLSSLLGPFTSYAVGSEVVAILSNSSLSSKSKTNLMQPARVSAIFDILNEGSVETKINCVRLIESFMEEEDFCVEIVSSHRLLIALMRLVKDKKRTHGNFPALHLLRSICSHERVRSLIVSIGSIPQLLEAIPFLGHDCVELAMSVIDVLTSVPEGRQALRDCSIAVSTMVKLLMGISDECTEYSISIMKSMCLFSPDECSAMAVDSGLVAKLLLIMQSGCSSTIKQRAAELLKLFSLNCSDTMFSSNCRFSRTIQ